MRALSIIVCLAMLLPSPCFALAPASLFSDPSPSSLSEEIKRISRSEEFQKRTEAFLDAWQNLKPGESLVNAFKRADRRVRSDLGLTTPTINFHHQIYPFRQDCVYLRGKIQTGPFKGSDCFVLFSKKAIDQEGKKQGSAILKDTAGMQGLLDLLGGYNKPTPMIYLGLETEKMLQENVRRYVREEKNLELEHQPAAIQEILKIRLANKIFRDAGASLPNEAWFNFMNQTALKNQPMLVRTAAAIMKNLFEREDIKSYLAGVFPENVFPHDAYGEVLHAIGAELAGRSYGELKHDQRILIAHRLFYVLGLNKPKNEWQHQAKTMLQHLAVGSPWGDWAYFMPPVWAEGSEYLKDFFTVDLPQQAFDWEGAMALSDPGYLDRYRQEMEKVLPEEWKDELFRRNLADRIWNDARWWGRVQKAIEFVRPQELKSARIVGEVKPLSELDILIQRARDAEREIERLAHDVRHNINTLGGGLKLLQEMHGLTLYDDFKDLHHVIAVLGAVRGTGIQSAKNEHEARMILEKLRHFRGLLHKALSDVREGYLERMKLISANFANGRIPEDDLPLLEMLESDPLQRALQLLKYERVEKVHVKDLITPKAVEEIFRGTDINVVIDVAENTPPLPLAAHQFFERVLNQFFRNAKDAMKEGGTLTVRARPYKDWARIEIEDTGHGISNAIRSHIFEHRFTHGKKTGTGLGLDIAKEMIRSYGGTVWVESEEGKGAKFVILMPSADAAVQEEHVSYGKEALAQAHGAFLQALDLPKDAQNGNEKKRRELLESHRFVLLRETIEGGPMVPGDALVDQVCVGADASGMYADIRHLVHDDLANLALRLTESGPKSITIDNLRIAVPLHARNKGIVRDLIREGVRVRDGRGQLIGADDDGHFEMFWEKLMDGTDNPRDSYGQIHFLTDERDAPLGLFMGEFHYYRGLADFSDVADQERDGELLAAWTEILGGQESSRMVDPGTGEASAQVLGAGDWSRSPKKAVVITPVNDHPLLPALKGIRIDPVTGDKTLTSLLASWGQPVRIIEAVYRGRYGAYRMDAAQEKDPVLRYRKMLAFANLLEKDSPYDKTGARLISHEVNALRIGAIRILEQQAALHAPWGQPADEEKILGAAL